MGTVRVGVDITDTTMSISTNGIFLFVSFDYCIINSKVPKVPILIKQITSSPFLSKVLFLFLNLDGFVFSNSLTTFDDHLSYLDY